MFNWIYRSKDADRVSASEIRWTGDDFRFCGVRFTSDVSWRDRKKSTDDCFIIVKNKAHLDTYLSHINIKAESILEVGFFQGGSSVFLDLLYHPKKLVCIDLRKDRIHAVDRYIERHGKGDQMKMVYGFDQGDEAGFDRLCRNEFKDGIDLVIDDASHQYELTKTTFSAVFPRVKPHGTYVIEDWGWAHVPFFQDPSHQWADMPALSNLVFELLMVSARHRDMIKSVQVIKGLCIITKGEAPVQEVGLNLDELYLSRGRALNKI